MTYRLISKAMVGTGRYTLVAALLLVSFAACRNESRDLGSSGSTAAAEDRTARAIRGDGEQSPAESSEAMQFVLDDSGAAIPTTAVDEESRSAYFAWFGHDDRGRSVVFVSRLESGSETPSEPVSVSGDKEAVNPHPQAPPQVAVGSDGAVYVAWSSRIEVEGRRFPASNILLARSTDGGVTFDEPVFVNRDAGGPPASHTFHNVTVGPDGRVYVSWLESRDATVDLHDHAAQHAHASNTVVRVVTSDDRGETFGEGVVVARGTCQCCRTALHIDDSGRLFVAWRHIYGINTRDIAVAWSDDGGKTFSDPTRVHVDNWAIEGCPHSGPALTSDAEGRLHVAWYTAASEERTGLYHATSDDRGQSFGPPASLERGVPIASAQLAVSDGRTWIAWEDPTERRIYAGTSEALNPGSARAYDGSAPTIAAADGIRVLAWQDDGRVLAVVNRW